MNKYKKITLITLIASISFNSHATADDINYYVTGAVASSLLCAPIYASYKTAMNQWELAQTSHKDEKVFQNQVGKHNKKSSLMSLGLAIAPYVGIPLILKQNQTPNIVKKSVYYSLVAAPYASICLENKKSQMIKNAQSAQNHENNKNKNNLIIENHLQPHQIPSTNDYKIKSKTKGFMIEKDFDRTYYETVEDLNNLSARRESQEDKVNGVIDPAIAKYLKNKTIQDQFKKTSKIPGIFKKPTQKSSWSKFVSIFFKTEKVKFGNNSTVEFSKDETPSELGKKCSKFIA